MNIASLLHFPQLLTNIIFAINKAGGSPYLVGGCVRDIVLGQEIKDIDIEVHGLTVEQLNAILQTFGHVREVGKKFGVLRLDNLDADWSMPRKDSKGRKPLVTIDPYMSIEDACKRRDLTMNAMALDLYKTITTAHEKNSSIDIIDPYGGRKDIAAKQLNAIDPHLFIEDPLRFFRVMQFIGRFEMTPSAELATICSTMNLHDEQTQSPISKERIFEEIKKLFLKSKQPSLGIRWLQKIGRLQEIFPELQALVGIPQRPDYHPEGDVFEHTMQSLDAAANLIYAHDEEKFIIMLTMLTHDLGKVSTTDAQLHCKGHEEAGVPLAEQFLTRITDNHFLITAVKKLVRHHCAPVQLTADNVRPQAFKRLALKLAPEVTLQHIGLVGMADILGRNPKSSHPTPTLCNLEPNLRGHIQRIELFLARAEKAQVLHRPEERVLLGRHLLDSVQPGPELGELLDKAYQIQIDEGVQDWQELKKRVCR